MMAFFQNTDYDVRTLGDGTSYFETDDRRADARAGSETKDDPGGDRSAERAS